MTKSIRYTLLSIRDLIVSAGPFAFLTIGLLVLAYWWLDPTPPKTVTLATGPAQSAYEQFGKRYAEQLRKDGIEVKLLPSQGSSENLQMIRDGRADVGFVQGGSAAVEDAEGNVVSLGSLFVEPIWLFYREDSAKKLNKTATIDSLVQLKGLRVNVGTNGSGVPRLMNQLLDINHIEPASINLSRLEQTPATVAFLGAELDAIVFASAPESLMVQMLLQTPGVKLMNFAQSEAYSRRFAFLTPVVLPRGVVDLAADLPPDDVKLVASTTSLLANDSTHPALLQLFAQAETELHGGAGWFNKAREFPNTSHSEFPISPEADRAFKSGPPLMQRYLPFWMANLVERMWLVLGIIIAIALPASRIVPPLYEFRIRSRVFKWYGRLRQIEDQADTPDAPGHSPEELLRELAELEVVVGKVNVPLSYADELYSLRNHIHMVRKKIRPT